jgi:hypothetical protein
MQSRGSSCFHLGLPSLSRYCEVDSGMDRVMVDVDDDCGAK